MRSVWPCDRTASTGGISIRTSSLLNPMAASSATQSSVRRRSTSAKPPEAVTRARRSASRTTPDDALHSPIGPFEPNVCAGCCSQDSVRMDLGSRAYVSGLLIGSLAVATLGLRSLLGLISGQAVLAVRALRLRGRFSPFQAFLSQRTPWGAAIRSPSPHLLLRRTAFHGAGHSRPCVPACWRAPQPACSGASALRPARARGRS